MSDLKTIIILFIFTFGVLFLLKECNATSQSNWKDSMYNQYDYNSFSSYKPANKNIDFKNIDYDLLCAAIFYSTNKERVNATSNSPNKGGYPLNLQPFKYSVYLKCAAYMHACDMVAKNFFSHENPYDAKKKTPFDRMAIYYVTDGKRAENIAYLPGINLGVGNNSYYTKIINGETIYMDPSTKKQLFSHSYNSLAAEVLDNWMHSDGHRRNILDKDLIYLGCGAYYYLDKSMPAFKCVQNFGSIVPVNP